MNVKKTAIAAVSYAMVAALAIGGTLAYQQDETLTDANVMTLGNVNIEQNEWQRQQNADGTYVTDTVDGMKSYILEKYQQNKEIVPVVVNPGSGVPGSGYEKDTTVRMSQVGSRGGMDVFEADNAVDKFVTVTNTGKTDAYVRTLVAVEKGKTDGSKVWFSARATDNVDEAGVKQPWLSEEVGTITIQGNEYLLFEYVYMGALASSGYVHKDGVLPAGETTYPSIAQFYLRAETTNEDIENLDGNKNGKLDILVVSQAVQADMDDLTASQALDYAFGEITETTHPWTETAFVDSAEELSAALAAGGEVVLTEDVDVDSTMAIKSGTNSTLNLNGFDINYVVENDKASAIINNAGTLDIVGNGTISFVAENPDLQEIPKYATNTITNTGTLTIGEGVTVTNESDGGASYAVDNHGTFYLNGGTLVGNRCALRVAKYNTDGVYFEMNSGTVTAATPAWIQLPGSNAKTAPKIDVVINGGTMQSTKASSADNDVMYTYSFGNSHANTSITINGGEFLGGTVSIGSGYKGDAPTLTINGGTFEYDVLQWLENDSSSVLFSANK